MRFEIISVSSKLSIVCYQSIRKGIMVILVLIPLAFSSNLTNVFYLPKTVFLRTIVLFLVFVWIVEILEEKKKDFYKVPWFWPILIFTAIIFLSTLAGANLRISFWGSYARLDGFYNFICYILLFFLTATHFKVREDLGLITKIAVLGSLPVALYGILQHFRLDFIAWPKTVEELSAARVMSTFGNPLDLGAYLAFVAVPFSLTGIFFGQKIKNKLFFIFSLILQLVCLLFTFSRSAWLGAMAAILIFVFLWAKKKKVKIIWFGSQVLIFCVLIILILATAFPLPPALAANPYFGRLLTSFNLSDPSSSARLLVWRAAGEAILRSPVFGYGPGGFIYAFNENYPPSLAKYSTQNFDYAHNLILDLGIWGGFPAVAVFLFIFFSFLHYGIKIFQRSQEWHFGILIVPSLVAYFIENFFTFNTPTSNLYFYFLLGLTSSHLFAAYNETGELQVSHAREEKTRKNNLTAVYLILFLVFAGFIIWSNFLPLAADYFFRQAGRSSTWQTKEKLYRRAVNLVGFKHYEYPIKFARSYLNLSQSLMEKNQKETAVKIMRNFENQLEGVISRYPKDIEPKRSLAGLYLVWQKVDETKIQEGEKLFFEMEQIAPRRQQTYWDWGKFYLTVGQENKAIEKYQYAVTLNPEVWVSYLELGQAYQYLGEKEKAQEAFAKMKILQIQ